MVITHEKHLYMESLAENVADKGFRRELGQLLGEFKNDAIVNTGRFQPCHLFLEGVEKLRTVIIVQDEAWMLHEGDDSRRKVARLCPLLQFLDEKPMATMNAVEESRRGRYLRHVNLVRFSDYLHDLFLFATKVKQTERNVKSDLVFPFSNNGSYRHCRDRWQGCAMPDFLCVGMHFYR